MKYLIYLLGAFGFVFLSCSKDKLNNPLDQRLEQIIKKVAADGQLDYFILPENTDYHSIPQDPRNPITKGKVELGRMLFFETGLAISPVHELGRGTYSCGTCHVPSAGFMPGSAQGIADGGVGFGENGERRSNLPFYDESELDVQGARPLSLINVAFVKNTSWNGQFGYNDNNEGTEDLWNEEELTEINHLGYFGLESQNIEGLAIHRMSMDDTVLDTFGYRALFDACFSEFPVEDRYNHTTMSLAISSYLRTLISNRAPFQDWLKGNELAMDDQMKKGALLFFGKAKCINCHNGPTLNNPDHFYALGVKDLYETGAFGTDVDDRRNIGRGGFTKKEEDMYKFKVPQLYNMKDANFYFHGSSKHSLQEVVEYFNEGIAENDRVPADQISPQFRPLELTEQEIEDLVYFLEKGLYDADMERYLPDAVLSGNCFPNNDPFSQIDLGCQ
ncbi:MAG: cytochrome c peroxidase [Bacteroidota bacterium]